MKKLLTLLLASMALYGCQKDITEDISESAPATRAADGSSEHYCWLGDEKISLQRMDISSM